MPKIKQSMLSVLGTLAFTTCVAAADPTFLKSASLSEIQKRSAYDVREMVRKMSVEEIEALAQTKKSLVLQKLDKPSNTDFEDFKYHSKLIGEGKEDMLLVFLDTGTDLDSILDRLAYGSYQIISKDLEDTHINIRMVMFNPEEQKRQLSEISGVRDVLGTDRTNTPIPKTIPGPDDTAYFLTDGSFNNLSTKEERYQMLLTLFTEEHRYVSTHIQLAGQSGTELEEIKRIQEVADRALQGERYHGDGALLVSTDPTIFNYRANRETLEELNADAEIENFIPIK